jgi:cephalosporin-C deacetylase-like acetyl esterase
MLMRLLLAACAVFPFFAMAAESDEPTTSRADLIQFLNAEALAHLDRRREAVKSIASRAEAEARQAEVRDRVLSLIGEPLHGVPLSAEVTGVVKGGGFRIENILYDAQPGRRVTANLFVPTEGKGPHPAVILSPGHSPDGKISNYAFAASLARNGIVALSYDIVGEGERLEYFDPATGKSRGERPTGDHSLAAFPAILAGEHVARYFIEDAMQGVDYLVSRPEVDADRIGAFGCSGGGAVTAYLAALDERVQAAATACYVTDFEHLLTTAGAQEAEQSIPGFIASGLDIADWVELAAPKPYAVISTTEDMFPFAGAEAAVDEARGFWAAYGSADRLEWITGPGGHGTIAPLGDEIVGFFRRALKAEAPDVAFTPLRPDDPSALLATATGQLMTSTETVTLADLERARIESIRPQSPLSPAALSGAIVELANVQPGPGGVPAVTAVSEDAENGLTVAKFQLASRIGPLDLRLIEVENAGVQPLLLVLDSAPMDFIARSDGPLAILAREGWTVVALQVRGADGEGEAKSAYVGDQNLLALTAMLVGYTLPGLRIDDAIAAMDWIESAMKGRSVTVLGVGFMGPVALQAALLDPRIDAVRIEGSPVSLRTAASAPMARDLPANAIPGMLSEYDLPDVIAALAPRPVTVAAPVGPVGEPLGEAELHALAPKAPNLTYTEKTILAPSAGKGGRRQ